jgi:ribose transport system substrate-binding protein
MDSRAFPKLCATSAMCLSLLFACSPKPTPDAAPSANSVQAGGTAVAAKKKIVGASLLTQTHVFYQDLVAAMKEEAGKQGIDLQIQFAEFNGSKQNEQMEMFILQGVNAIIVSPNDSAAISPAINDAKAKGIPVFTTDIAAHGTEVVSHIASDNVQGGRLIGEYLAKLLGGKGRVAIIDHPEAASVQERVAGFLEAIGKSPEIQIVQRVAGLGQRDKALRATQDLLQADSNLDGIFGINDDSALGALAAVEEAGLQNKILIVGYDGTPEARAAIAAGKALKADTVQFPEQIGKKTIETVAAHLRGEQVSKVVAVEVGIIDAESLQGAKPQ